MKIELSKKAWICFAVCLLVVVIGIVADQLTKQLFEKLNIQGDLPIVIIEGVAEFDYALNNGAAWGSFSGSSVLFFVLTVIALPIFCYVFLTRLKHGWWSSLGFAMVISGTIGNAIDRLLLGYGFFDGAVRDFLATKFLGRMDFICNVADILLCVGVVAVILGMMFFDSDGIFKKENRVIQESAANNADNDNEICTNNDEQNLGENNDNAV